MKQAGVRHRRSQSALFCVRAIKTYLNYFEQYGFGALIKIKIIIKSMIFLDFI